LTKIKSNRLRTELGGRGLLSKNGYLVIGVLSFTASMLVVPAGPHATALLWWPVHSIALAACAGWLVLFRQGFFRNRGAKPISLWWIAFFGISLGAIKGLVTGVLAVAFGLESDLARAIDERIVQTSFLGLFAVFALAIIEAMLDRYQVERDLLVTERVQQQIVDSDGREAEDSTELREFIAVAKSKLEAITNEPKNLAEQKQVTATLIRDIVETGLRPLSHRLWQKENAKVLNFRFVDLARVAVVGQPVALLPALGIYFFGALATLAAHISLPAAMLRALVGALIMGVVFLVARLRHTKSQALAWLNFVLANIIATLAVVNLTDLWFGSIKGISAVGTGIAVGIWMTEVSFISGFVVAAFRNHVRVRDQLEALLMKPGVDFAARKAHTLLMNRDLANYLHGSVQNRLLSAALRIESGHGDSADLVSELRAVATGDLKSQLVELAARWTGYVDIRFEIAEQTFGESVDTKILQVANEAISNAVRHGLAGKLDIKVWQPSAHTVEIIATDDGLGPRTGVAGLGSALFESLAGDEWSLRSGQTGGSRLAVRLAE
jgi:hypothetical protein